MPQNKHIQQLQQALLPLQQQLTSHSLYKKLNSLAALKHFMSIHVFAVWDFMNLLTTLQLHFTTTSTPWRPAKDAHLARFINEIKLEEESDIIDGTPTSHFEYYIKSMTALRIDTTPITQFLNHISTTSYNSLIDLDIIPIEIKPFLKTTYDCIQSGIIGTAASFTFGRETLIPQMFIRILDECQLETPEIITFKHYLERHIELDGTVHGALSLKLLEIVCVTNDSAWCHAEESAKKAITARIQLFDSIEKTLSEISSPLHR